MMYKLFYLIIIILFLQSTVYAYRPFATEDAGVAVLGENKVELGYEGVGISMHSIARNSFAFLIGIGLGNAEIMFETPYCAGSTSEDEDKGLQDFVIAAKLRVAGKDDAGIALKTEYSYGSDLYGLSAVFTHSFNWVVLHAQCGWISNYSSDGFICGLGLDLPLFNGFTVIIDNFLEHLADEYCYQILGGGILSVNEQISIDAAFGLLWVYQRNNKREYVTTAGCSLIF